MKKIKVGINGLGRIGRAFLRSAAKYPEIEVVAVNDLGEKANMEYLLKYDSVYGRSNVTLEGIKYLSEKEPAKLPWKEFGVDVVVESTGFFTSAEKSQGHIDAGAKRVVITAPLKEMGEMGKKGERREGKETGGTVLMGLNEEKLKNCTISSNASCTTNAASPIIAILDEVVGIEKAVLNTVHAYTATQALVDGPAGKKGFREGRAAAANIIPSSTGAAIAVTKAYPSLEGKFDGISLRVPVICGSIADITFIAKRDTSVEEVNATLTKAAKDKRWQGIFAVAEDELVSSDILGRPEGAIAELSMTRVVGGNLVKVLAWYDNESGYANTLVKHVLKAGQSL
ncbi:MAG: Glyceraldehyde 3-phosphate dehydrogenase [Candidatus Kaiserbacteria bacterium GW2011_GWA2_49_19]|uniref:Glyceraldehyde 3-phosphate dehydrogenase n=1 Tax=Candidatus Kaiserbacteria bacterium GW2011_GWA2_49_19 TaxID=1618669 RepID=A0A0G1Y3L2_9BACT|nr:MAG: Glyceraldehyde 3-phosphate dehydrogenase [Candidatus Kaiserbacteria bacterium GW2011_GWA2_49_19]